jgi:hypothetical protein
MKTTKQTDERTHWRVDDNGDVLDSRGLLVARPQHKKDGPMIAAAHELLEALAELQGWVERVVVPNYTPRKPMPENCRKALASARAAIAKATSTTADKGNSTE